MQNKQPGLVITRTLSHTRSSAFKLIEQRFHSVVQDFTSVYFYKSLVNFKLTVIKYVTRNRSNSDLMIIIT